MKRQKSPMLIQPSLKICDYGDNADKFVDDLLDSDILNNASNSSYGEKLLHNKKIEKFLDDEFMAGLDEDKPDSVYFVNHL